MKTVWANGGQCMHSISYSFSNIAEGENDISQSNMQLLDRWLGKTLQCSDITCKEKYLILSDLKKVLWFPFCLGIY